METFLAVAGIIRALRIVRLALRRLWRRLGRHAAVALEHRRADTLPRNREDLGWMIVGLSIAETTRNARR